MITIKRPFTVTCLIGLVLTFSGLQAIKLWAVVSSRDFLKTLPMSVTPVFLGVSAAIWLVIGSVLFFGLLLAKAWSPRLTRWAAIIYAVTVWLDRLILQAKGPQQSNWLFELALSVILIASIFGILALPKMRACFGEGNE